MVQITSGSFLDIFPTISGGGNMLFDQNPATTSENSENGRCRPSLYHASMPVSPGSMIILTISDIISEP